MPSGSFGMTKKFKSAKSGKVRDRTEALREINQCRKKLTAIKAEMEKQNENKKDKNGSAVQSAENG